MVINDLLKSSSGLDGLHRGVVHEIGFIDGIV
jgi:hypothetical protein